MKKLLFALSLLISVQGLAEQIGTCEIQSQTIFVASTTSVKALDYNSKRKCLIVQSQCSSAGSSTIEIKLASAGEGIIMTPNAIWEANPVPLNSLFIKVSAGVCDVYIGQGK